MSNKLYVKGKAKRHNGTYTYNLAGSGALKIVLIDTASYTFSQSHEFYTDLAGVVGTPVTLTNVALTVSGDNVLLSHDPIAITGLTGAPTIEAFVVFHSTGTPSADDLIGYFDTATGLPTIAGANTVTITCDATDKLIKF